MDLTNIVISYFFILILVHCDVWGRGFYMYHIAYTNTGTTKGPPLPVVRRLLPPGQIYSVAN